MKNRNSGIYNDVSQLLSTTVCLALLSILPIRRYMYEIFLKTHLALALVLATTMWLHIRLGKNRGTVLLCSLSGFWILQHTGWLALLFYRNSGSSRTNIALTKLGTQALDATIVLRRPWDVKPGQYIYLTLPKVNRHRVGFAQSHPYLIAWSEADSLTLLIERDSGFSNSLFSCPTNSTSAIVDGPYGNPISLDDYDKVLFVASGIGIAAHLLAIRHLVEAHNDRRSRVRRVTLLWFVETPGELPYTRVLHPAKHRRARTMGRSIPADVGEARPAQNIHIGSICASRCNDQLAHSDV